MATLKAAYNRVVATFSRFWAPYRESSEDDNETESSTVVSSPEIVVDEVSDLTLVPSSTTAVRLREGTSKRREARELFRRSYYALRSSTEHLRKRSPRRMAEIRLNNARTIEAESFMSRLNDYNTYFDGQPEKLAKRQNKKGELVVDGLLNIYWGLRTAIRLQLADDEDKFRPRIIGIPAHKEADGTDGQSSEASNSSGSAALDVENGIWGKTRQRRPEKRRGAVRLKVPGQRRATDDDEDEDDLDDNESLARTNSVIMRKKTSRYLRHRASINGHVYNYKTSVFTPGYGSVTKVRVTSQNDAHTVISKLFSKFRVENSPNDFSLYVVKETEERRELPGDEFPLLSRVLTGPNEKLGKIFLMERKMHKEITSEVAQYIKLDAQILHVFLTKFAEEEEKEILKMKKRFDFYRKMLKRRVREMKQSQS